MKRLPVRVLLTAWFALAVLAIVTPLVLAMLALEWRGAVAGLNHHLDEDAAVAAQLIRVTPAGLAWSYAGRMDPGYDAGPERWVEVFDTRGRVLFTRGAARRPEVRQALPAVESGRDRFTTATTAGGARVRLRTVRRTIDGQPLVIRVARSEDEIRDDWTRLAITFAVVIPFAVAMAAVAGYGVAGRALAPVTRVTERARQISAERLGERLPVENPHDELGELAQVFNATFERLESSFARLRRFTADASHELRTPLTAIRSVGEVALRGARTPEAYRDAIGSMLEEADRLTRLVGSLLLLARLEDRQIQITRMPVDLAALGAAVVAQLAVLAEEKGITLRMTGAGPVTVVADGDMVHQAVVNVVDNAIKFTPPGGTVTVTASRQNGQGELEVADEGPGIPPEDAPLIFDRFYRVDTGRTREAGGTGLGLAIALGAVRANGGRLDVWPRETGGSRFVIALPTA